MKPAKILLAALLIASAGAKGQNSPTPENAHAFLKTIFDRKNVELRSNYRILEMISSSGCVTNLTAVGRRSQNFITINWGKVSTIDTDLQYQSPQDLRLTGAITFDNSITKYLDLSFESYTIASRVEKAMMTLIAACDETRKHGF